jgi:cation diffusion facilitator family transporter
VDHASRRAIFAAFVANLGIAFAKLLVFALTGAASMLAEAIHSLADTGNQGLLMFGGARSRRPADDAHPFGYGRLRYFSAFVVALVLFSVGGLFAVFEGVEKLVHPHMIDAPGLAIGVLFVSACLESFSLRTALHESRVEREGRSILQFVRRTKIPELAVVLLEDIGALLGLAFAFAGVVLAEALHSPRWDAAGSLAIGILLVVIATVLAVEMSSLLVGEAATPEMVDQIRSILAAHPDVDRVIALRTQHAGPEDLVVNAKLEFGSTLTAPQMSAVVNELEVSVRHAVPEARTIFIEPDVYRPPDRDVID